MGTSPSIEELQKRDDDFRKYMQSVQDDTNAKKDQLQKEIDDIRKKFYQDGGFDDAKPRIQGSHKDMQHISDWSMDNITRMLGSIRLAIFGDGKKPEGTPVADKDITKDLAVLGIHGMELYILNQAFSVIQGVLEAFSTQTSAKYVEDIKVEQLAPGLTLFIAVAQFNYKSDQFFTNELITSNLYVYDARFSLKHGINQAKETELSGLSNQLALWVGKSDSLTRKIAAEEDYSAVLQLAGQLKGITKQIDDTSARIAQMSNSVVRDALEALRVPEALARARANRHF